MQNQQVPQPPQPLDPRIIPAYYRDDEISLVDLWIAIARRKKLVLGVAGAVLLIGLAAALVMPKKYDYSAVIEIGGKLQWRDGVSTLETIESPDTVKSKLESAYITAAIRKHNSTGEAVDFIPRIKVQAPKDSNTLIISSTAAEEKGDIIKSIMLDAAQALIKDHYRVTATDIAQIQNELSDAQRELEGLNDPDSLAAKIKGMEAEVEGIKKDILTLEGERKLLEAVLERTNQQEALLKGQLEEITALIKDSIKVRANSSTGTKNATDAAMQLLIDNQIQHYFVRQGELEERLFVGIQAERDRLNEKIQENTRQLGQVTQQLEQKQAELAAFRKDLQRQIQAKEDQIKTIRTKLDNILATRLVLEPEQGLEPTGPGKALILALAGFLGLFAGLFAAFIAEFRDKVLERMAEQGEESASA
ncbi:MAG: Wzz/FepE/Etk N-terminal domain-containing protein [Halothiobacillaceae bacterium]